MNGDERFSHHPDLTTPQGFAWLRQTLQALGERDPAYTARLVLAELRGLKGPQACFTATQWHCGPRLPADASRRLAIWLQARSQGQPWAYLFGHSVFWGREFQVNEAVLIPRADSEVLVERGLEALGRLQRRAKRPLNICDLGTGSGALLITLALEADLQRGTQIAFNRLRGTDVSVPALQCAAANAQQLMPMDPLAPAVSLDEPPRFPFEWIEADFEAGLLGLEPQQGWDLIISNPPYLAVEELKDLDREVIDYEPRSALTDEGDGLSFYRRLLQAAPNCLTEQGEVWVEFGYQQAEPLKTLVEQSGAKLLGIWIDYAGHPRVMGWTYSKQRKFY